MPRWSCLRTACFLPLVLLWSGLAAADTGGDAPERRPARPPDEVWLLDAAPATDVGGIATPPSVVEPLIAEEPTRLDWKRLLRPRVDVLGGWEAPQDGFSLNLLEASVQVPLYPIFGPPPPFLTAGYGITALDAPPAWDLPEQLHEFSLGLSWMRPINERWMARMMVQGAFASDLHNTSSDAWRLRGGGFALFRPNDRWSFAFGALATGRDDVPVIPAVGAIWEPSPELVLSLMLPDPKVSLLLVDSPRRQHWAYLGGGMSGGTWAYDRIGGVGERVTYREWRLVLGWESMPPKPPGSFVPTRPRIHAEIGYVFGREFEFDGNFPDLSPGNTLVARAGVKF